MRAIARVPAPDFGALGEAWAEDAAKKFDELAGSELDRAKEADRDRGRAKIDEAVATLLLDPDAVRAIREAWVEEPSVHAGRGDEETAARYESASEREHAAGIQRLI